MVLADRWARYRLQIELVTVEESRPPSLRKSHAVKLIVLLPPFRCESSLDNEMSSKAC